MPKRKSSFELEMEICIALRSMKRPYKGVTKGKSLQELEAMAEAIRLERKSTGHVAFEVMHVR